MAEAGTVRITRVSGSYAGNGGEFHLSRITGELVGKFVGGAAQLSSDSFQSFCLERDESVRTNPHTYTINTEANGGGVNTDSGDPLSPEAAYLFTGFTLGTLSTPYNYALGAGRSADARSMQLAIWLLEDEILPTHLEYVANTKAKSFVAEAKSSGWTDIGNVRVLNMLGKYGRPAQDMLVMVPLPAAVWAGGGLLGCLGMARRFRRED
jgi:hypothetical protein